MNRLFYAKILLFGEYSIILNSDALTIPFTKYSARLSFPEDKITTSDNKIINSNKNLWSFFAYLKSSFNREYFNADQFENELSKGIYFKSNIPEHYGLGSSGALVASVYDRYFLNQEPTNKPEGLIRLKDTFSKMESYFHGRSSGIDPLSCYMGFPLYFHDIHNVKEIEMEFSFKNLLQHFFLVDSEHKAETGPLVKLFLEKTKHADFYIHLQKQLITAVNGAISAFLQGNQDTIKESFKSISAFQLTYMKEMIPEKFISLWKSGLESDQYYLKLCGSGGGGYLIGIEGRDSKINKIFKEYNLLRL